MQFVFLCCKILKLHLLRVHVSITCTPEATMLKTWQYRIHENIYGGRKTHYVTVLKLNFILKGKFCLMPSSLLFRFSLFFAGEQVLGFNRYPLSLTVRSLQPSKGTPSLLPANFRYMSQVPEGCETSQKVQFGSCMRSGQSAVKPHGITAGCPQ